MPAPDPSTPVRADLRDRLPQWFAGAKYSVEDRAAVIRVTFVQANAFGIPANVNLDLQADDEALDALEEAFIALAERARAARSARLSVIELPTTKPS